MTLTRKDGTKRTILVVTDERAGAAASAECPGGGLHLFDITGAKERNPEKIGTWFIPTVQPQDGATCTSHVLRIYPKQKLMTIAWYSQGVRVLDISGLARFQGTPASVGIGDGVGMKEVGHYVHARLRHLVVQDQQDPPRRLVLRLRQRPRARVRRLPLQRPARSATSRP